MIRFAALFLALLVIGTGCYRTHYVQFSPANPELATEVATDRELAIDGWQSFFVYGLFPGEKNIDAQKACEESGGVSEIRTRRTFLEGLVAAFAGYYINIYSPWDGAIYCAELAGGAQ